MATDCLESLIGLAAAPVPCFPFPTDEAKVASITSSQSALYLTDVAGLPIRPAQSTQAGPRDFYDRLAQARRTGIAKLRSALTLGLSGKFIQRPGWQGSLGKQQFTETAPAGPATMTLHTKNLGMVLRISSLQAHTTTNEVDCPVLLDDTPVGTLSSTNQGGIQFALDIPLDGKTHILQVELPAGTRPRVNKLCCGGCGQCTPLAQFLTNYEGNIQGLSVTASVVCPPETKDIPCYAAAQVGGSPRFPELHEMLAQAVWYASAEAYCISLLTDTAEGSRYTAMTPEQLQNQIAMYAGHVDKHVTWLASRQALVGMEHPCYFCQPVGGPVIVKSYGR